MLETRLAKDVPDAPGDPALATQVHEQYVWSQRYIDSPILRDRDEDEDDGTGDLGKADSGLEQRVYYLTDANFNVTALTDATGSVVERYAYDAYGAPRFMNADWSARDDSAYANSVLFAGYYYDAKTLLYCVRNRYHSPAYGRWLSRDPLGYVDGMSLYEYCGSDPYGLGDPWGTKVYLVTSPPFGWVPATHAAIVVDTGHGVHVFEVSNQPNMGLSSSMGAVGSSAGSAGSSMAGPVAPPSQHPGEGEAGPTYITNANSGSSDSQYWNSRAENYLQDLRQHPYEWTPLQDNTDDYDQDYINAAKRTQFGAFDFLYNNCCDWAGDVIEEAGGEWPITEDLNYGFNPGNPNYTGPRPPKPPPDDPGTVKPKNGTDVPESTGDEETDSHLGLRP